MPQPDQYVGRDEASTVGEWIAALAKLDPSLPLYVRSKYTGDVSWTQDHPVRVRGLSPMEPGVVGRAHACILY